MKRNSHLYQYSPHDEHLVKYTYPFEDLIFDDDEDFCDDDDLFVETECPVCGETIGYYHGVYDEPIEVLCPNCDAVVAVLGDDYEEVEDDEIVLEEELDED